MTPQEQLAFIKQKVIEANGSILDLKFGCEVKILWNEEIREMKYPLRGDFEGIDIIEIIGRPIQLSDVLLAIHKINPHSLMIAINGVFYEWEHMDKMPVPKDIQWNLLLPLDGQSEEVWAFLAELLHV